MFVNTDNTPAKINHVSHVFCKFWRNMGTTQQLLRAKNCTKDTTFDKIIAIHNLGKLTDDKQSIANTINLFEFFCWVHFKNFATKKTAFLFFQECCFIFVLIFPNCVYSKLC